MPLILIWVLIALTLGALAGVTAFFLTEAITVIWWAAGRYADHAPLPVARALEFVSIHSRFADVARGVIDTRDLLAFAAVTAVALSIAVALLQRERLRP